MTSKEDDSVLKLADFGLAIISESDTLTDRMGTPGYVAPEILLSRPYGTFEKIIIYYYCSSIVKQEKLLTCGHSESFCLSS